MAVDNNNLIWVDLEMTGLDPDKDRVIEIATVVTNASLAIVAEGPVIAIRQTDAVLEGMDSWNRDTHTNSGLIDRVRESDYNESSASAETINFFRQHVEPENSPMCGNSVCQDRRFLYRWMPDVERYFHYRNLDVSSVKELCNRWAPQIAQGLKKKSTHQALQDIRDSIEELRYYRDNLFNLNS